MTVMSGELPGAEGIQSDDTLFVQRQRLVMAIAKTMADEKRKFHCDGNFVKCGQELG